MNSRCRLGCETAPSPPPDGAHTKVGPQTNSILCGPIPQTVVLQCDPTLTWPGLMSGCRRSEASDEAQRPVDLVHVEEQQLWPPLRRVTQNELNCGRCWAQISNTWAARFGQLDPLWASSHLASRPGESSLVVSHPYLQIATTPLAHLLAIKVLASHDVCYRNDVQLLLDALQTTAPVPEAVAPPSQAVPPAPPSMNLVSACSNPEWRNANGAEGDRLCGAPNPYG
jgi:hypothetical protein